MNTFLFITKIEFIFLILFALILIILYLKLVEYGKEWKKSNDVVSKEKDQLVRKMLINTGIFFLVAIASIIFLIIFIAT